jgi:hypothetical protein
MNGDTNLFDKVWKIVLALSVAATFGASAVVVYGEMMGAPAERAALAQGQAQASIEREDLRNQINELRGLVDSLVRRVDMLICELRSERLGSLAPGCPDVRILPPGAR